MFHVLRHYLPFRKGLLVLSETVLLTVVVMVGMSAHLWLAVEKTQRLLAFQGLSVEDARWRCFFSAVMVSALAQVMISLNELYDFRISSSPYERAARFLGSAGSAILLCIVSVTLAELWDVQRVLDFPGLPLSQRIVVLTSSLVVAFALLYGWRNVFHAWLRRTRFHERLLILGSGKIAQRMVDYLLSRPDSGYEIIGMIAPRRGPEERRQGDRRRGGDRAEGERAGTGNPWYEASHPRGPRPLSLAVGSAAPAAAAAPEGLGRLVLEDELRSGVREALDPAEEPAQGEPDVADGESLHELATRLGIDDIIVALEERRGQLPTQDLLRCRLDGIVVEEAESFFERLTGKIPAEAMRPSYLIFNEGFVQHPLSQAAKRMVDVGIALAGLAASWPFLVATAILVRLDSPGPILFRQERTGQGGKPLTLLKFRSMRADAEKETGPVWATKEDPRVTRVGRFIRRSRLDELPQLFNVLAGSMSMVGPRPERPAFVEGLAGKIPYYHQRHIVKPGITGWAQINYPYGNTVEDALQKLQYDLFYIKYQSILFDLSILFNTIKTVILRKGT